MLFYQTQWFQNYKTLLQVFGAFYILMTRRKRIDYQAVFQFLKDKYPNLNVEKTMTDFEGALRRAILSEWPNVKLESCWAHYARVILSSRRIQF